METEEFIKQLNDYLLQNGCATGQFLNTSCYIQNSPLNGRGLFAARDFSAGEIIFCDKPFLFGPRYNAKAELHCVICGTVKNIKNCPKGCGLPICSIYCELSIQHLKECSLITSIVKERQLEISVDIFRVLMPLRALLLENKLIDLLLHYSAHKGPQNEVEIQLVKKMLILSTEQEELLQKICAVINANSFEAIRNDNDHKISIRALYPLAAIMNHSCLPNTFHYFDGSADDLIIIKASKFIPKNSEIFTTYTSLLWGTTSRRHHLFSTKNFWCTCERCADPKEFGTGLSGLRCIDKDCSGILYPQNSLILKSGWECEICGMIMPIQKVGIVQSTLGGLLKTMDVANLRKLICFLQERLSVVVPLNNQIAVEIKLKIIWCLGYIDNYQWTGKNKEMITDDTQIFV